MWKTKDFSTRMWKKNPLENKTLIKFSTDIHSINNNNINNNKRKKEYI